MEENMKTFEEVEDIDTVDEAEEEVSEGSTAGAFVAGMVGGFVAYAVVSGAKRLIAFAGAKWKARKRKKTDAPAIDVDIVESETGQKNSKEENPTQ